MLLVDDLTEFDVLAAWLLEHESVGQHLERGARVRIAYFADNTVHAERQVGQVLKSSQI